MVREFGKRERHIHVNAVGIGDVITIPYGVVENCAFKDIGLEGIYEIDFDIRDAVKYHNMYSNQSWYRICNTSAKTPILLRINGNSVIGE